MTPAPPTLEEQAAAARSHAGITADKDDDREITGVHGQIIGVDDDVFFSVTPPTTQEAHAVQRITPPRLIRQQVEVEDVDSDDEDEGEEWESNIAPQDNVGGDQEEEASEADAPQLGRGHRVRTQPDYYQAD